MGRMGKITGLSLGKRNILKNGRFDRLSDPSQSQ
jgi:hypothetical protein